MSWLVRNYNPMWVRLGLVALSVALSVATGQSVVWAGDDSGGGG